MCALNALSLAHTVVLAFADYARNFFFPKILKGYRVLLKPNHSLYYLYILKYVLLYSIWRSEALLWRLPFFFFSQPAAGLTNWVLVQDSQAGTPLVQNKQKISLMFLFTELMQLSMNKHE